MYFDFRFKLNESTPELTQDKYDLIINSEFCIKDNNIDRFECLTYTYESIGVKKDNLLEALSEKHFKICKKAEDFFK